MADVAESLACEFCGREFTPGSYWHGANYCRAAYLAGVIREHPDMSTWELAQFTGMTYADSAKGLAKARDEGLVEYTAETREAGGTRYRYRLADGWEEVINRWRARSLI